MPPTGDYVAVIIDKTLLHPSALAVADRALRFQPADIVTWHNEGFVPVNEVRDLARGRFQPVVTPHRPALYDATAELAVRFANASRRGRDAVHYVRGKIVFGAYSRALLQRIRERTGRLFHPLSPDYTSMVPACVLAEGALDVGRPLLVSYNSVRSNGRRVAADPAHGRRFIEATDPALIEALPIPGLYTSVHNIVAYDLASSAALLPAGSRRRWTCRTSCGAHARTWPTSPGPTPVSVPPSSSCWRRPSVATTWRRCTSRPSCAPAWHAGGWQRPSSSAPCNPSPAG